jgi:hypothetical protein
MPALTPRYVRNSAILAKTETTYGTDPTPTGGANAILVSIPVATSNTVVANHTYNEGQIEWFKAGSALNLIKAKA